MLFEKLLRGLNIRAQGRLNASPLAPRRWGLSGSLLQGLLYLRQEQRRWRGKRVDVKTFCRGAKGVAGLGTAQIFLKNTATEQLLSVVAGGAGRSQRLRAG